MLTCFRRIPIEGDVNGKLKVISNGGDHLDANKVFGSKKNDHEILNAALRLRAENPEMRVILVSKDINLRLKARALNLEGRITKPYKLKISISFIRVRPSSFSKILPLLPNCMKKGSSILKNLWRIPRRQTIFTSLKSHSLGFRLVQFEQWFHRKY